MNVGVLICAGQRHFPDDRAGVCPCGHLIFFRPHSAEMAVKLCWPCARKRIEAEGGRAEFYCTDQTRREVMAYRKAGLN
jgi:hypothetical protein